MKRADIFLLWQGILRCSACHLRFKEKIISKCLHSECRGSRVPLRCCY